MANPLRVVLAQRRGSLCGLDGRRRGRAPPCWRRRLGRLLRRNHNANIRCNHLVGIHRYTISYHIGGSVCAHRALSHRPLLASLVPHRPALHAHFHVWENRSVVYEFLVSPAVSAGQRICGAALGGCPGCPRGPAWGGGLQHPGARFGAHRARLWGAQERAGGRLLLSTRGDRLF